MDTMNNINKKLVALIFIGLVGIFGVYQSVVWLSHRGKTAITINAVPSNSVITIDGEQTGPGVHYIEPGRHELTAAHEDEGFGKVSRTISVDDSPQTINLLPSAVSDKAKTFLADNPDEASRREQIGGEEFQKSSEILSRKYPFIGDLPVLTRGFTIYQADAARTKLAAGDAAIALRIEASTPADRVRAVEWVRDQLGIDPSAIEIDFVDQTNVFQPGVSL